MFEIIIIEKEIAIFKFYNSSHSDIYIACCENIGKLFELKNS
jgi:hypothetical protein